MKIERFEINEKLCKQAHEMNSWSDYITGTTTNSYNAYIDECEKLLNSQIEKYPDEAEHLTNIANRYSRRLADWYNENARIESMYPSIMIAGGSNFNCRKKEQQNSRRDTHRQKWNEIQGLLDKIKSCGTGGIKSGDADAIGKLERKIEKLEQEQEKMKSINAYFRKNNTLIGCELMTEDAQQKCTAEMQKFGLSKPYPSWCLSNNNQNINRLKKRLEELKSAKSQETTEKIIDGVDGVKIIENTETMRLQLVFDGKPEPEIRDILKHWGFKWAPSQGAWQRMLNNNGKYAAKQVINKLQSK